MRLHRMTIISLLLSSMGAAAQMPGTAEQQAREAIQRRQDLEQERLDNLPSINKRSDGCRGMSESSIVNDPQNTMSNGGYVIVNAWDLHPYYLNSFGRDMWGCAGYVRVVRSSGYPATVRFLQSTKPDGTEVMGFMD